MINFYGEEASSFLHQSGTDRFWVKWFLTSERVVKRLNSTKAELANPSDKVLIEIPADVNALGNEAAWEWRQRTRSSFTEALEAGYVVFFFSSRRRHTRFDCDWSSDVCSSD